MQQPGWISNVWSEVKEDRPKRPYTIWLHLCDILEKAKLYIETENQTTVARGWSKERVTSEKGILGEEGTVLDIDHRGGHTEYMFSKLTDLLQ